jgi:hypothetical protein
MLTLDELIKEDERVSKQFVEVINKINNGEIASAEQLPSDPNLFPDIFNPSNKRLFFLCAQTMQFAPPRYNNNPAFTHPSSAAYLISLFMGKENINRDKAIRYLLTHDHLEDAAKYDVAKYEDIRNHIGPGYKDELDAAILLSRPKSSSYPPIEHVNTFSKSVTYVAKVLQVKCYGNTAHAHALAGDNLDNQINIKFLDEKPAGERDSAISTFIARSIFIIQELGNTIPELAQYMGYYNKSMIERYYLQSSVDFWLRQLNEVNELYKTEPRLWIGINNHLEKFGFEIPKIYNTLPFTLK